MPRAHACHPVCEQRALWLSRKRSCGQLRLPRCSVSESRVAAGGPKEGQCHVHSVSSVLPCSCDSGLEAPRGTLLLSVCGAAESPVRLGRSRWQTAASCKGHRALHVRVSRLLRAWNGHGHSGQPGASFRNAGRDGMASRGVRSQRLTPLRDVLAESRSWRGDRREILAS